MSQRKSGGSAVFVMTRCGILAAMAVILYYIEISGRRVLQAGFVRPLPAILVGALRWVPCRAWRWSSSRSLVHMLGTSTACVGELADIIMSSCFVVPASLIYRRHKDRKSAVLSMLIGTVLMTIAGVLVNYFILIPAYQTLMNLPLEVIVGMGTKVWSYIDNTVKLVIFITAPFNVLKGTVLSVVTYLLYKRVSPLLHQKSGR